MDPNTVSTLLGTWGYAALLLLLILTGVGSPIPEDLLLLTAGYLVFSEVFQWPLALGVSLIGVVVSDLMLYSAGRHIAWRSARGPENVAQRCPSAGRRAHVTILFWIRVSSVSLPAGRVTMNRSAVWICAALVSVVATPSLLSAQANGLPPQRGDSPRTDLRAVLTDSVRLLAMEHSVRIAAQEKTRRELGGSFWTDYRRSLRFPRQWGDGDGWLVNYVGHPGHGAAAGYIWIHHDPNAVIEDVTFVRDYWWSRLRASAWSAAYSLQFELGPLSEASIGNVGKNPSTTGWLDHVVTPLGGFGVMVAEDAIDRYVIGRLERRLRNTVIRGVVRTILNPARATANVAGARAPWYRPTRPLSSIPHGTAPHLAVK